MSLVSTPYTEVYVKRSFLSGAPNYGKDDTIPGVLVAIRFVFNRAPLYVVWFPSMLTSAPSSTVPRRQMSRSQWMTSAGGTASRTTGS